MDWIDIAVVVLYLLIVLGWLSYLCKRLERHNLAKGYQTCPRCHATVRPGVGTCEWCSMILKGVV